MQVLRKGTSIYRGSSNEPMYARAGTKPTFLRNLPVYFGPTQNVARTYGQVIEYKLLSDVHLLDMSRPEIIASLLERTKSENVKKSLKKAFRTSNASPGVRRFSRIKYDLYVAQLICKLGYDGYYAPELKNAKTTQGKFPPEIVLCNPKEVLTVHAIFQATSPPRMKRGVTMNLENAVKRTIYF